MTESGEVLSSEKEQRVSRFLSGLLRHFPDEHGVRVYSNGWMKREVVVSVCEDNYSWFESRHIEYIVENDSKGRYELTDDGEWIRALSGHSISVSIETEDDGDIPNTIFHGTPIRNVDSILQDGLQPMSREKVHLSRDSETAREVGERHAASGEQVVVFSVEVSCLNETVHEPQDGLFVVSKVEPDCLQRID